MQRIAVSDITGRPLVNARGNELGEVERVVMSPQQPGEAFAVVAYGGFLGVGEKRVTIPLRDLTLRGDELVVEGMTDDQLRELPDFREGAGMQPMDEGEAAQIRVQG
jgi:sporulation protein YlmC with PRC-barrel domain